jgi:hypothetical protein
MPSLRNQIPFSWQQGMTLLSPCLAEHLSQLQQHPVFILKSYPLETDLSELLSRSTQFQINGTRLGYVTGLALHSMEK